MIFGQRQPPRIEPKSANLPEWIDIATRNLVPSTQARIRADIEAHYAEAVQASRASGTSEMEAHATALANLGDADAASKRFCREHPSTLDANFVTSQAWLQILMGILWVGASIVFQFIGNPDVTPGPRGQLAILFCFFVVFPAVAVFVRSLVLRASFAVTPRLVFMLVTAILLNIGVFVVLQFTVGHSSSHFGNLADFASAYIFVAQPLWFSWRLLCVHKKLAVAQASGLPLPTYDTPIPPQALS